jgi:predicted PurR-regulated permease PerM
MARRLLARTPMDSRISVRWLALIGAILIALYLCWRIAQPFLDVLLWALVLAMVFNPVHRRIQARLQKPTLSAGVSTLLVVVMILGPATFITVAVINELRTIALGLNAHEGAWVDANTPLVGPLLAWVDPYVDLDQLQSADFIQQRLQAWSAAMAAGAIGIVGGVMSTIVQTALVIFTLFYLFRDGDAIRRVVTDMVPLDARQTRDVIARTREVVGASVYGVIVIAAIQGALGFFIFWVLGLPSALLWGVVMFFLSMIPMAGAFLVWAPAALYLAASGAYTQAILLTIWGVVVVGSIDNVLSPRLVGKRARMHELLIFFAVLGGIQAFGVIGVVLGPVVVAITLALIEMLRQVNAPPEETLNEPTIIDQQSQVRQAS